MGQPTVETVAGTIDMHGLSNYLQQSNKFKKLFWICLLVCSGILLVVSVVVCIYQFLDNPIITSWSLEKPLAKQLPNVKICPMNWIHADRLADTSEFIEEYAKYYYHKNNGKILRSHFKSPKIAFETTAEVRDNTTIEIKRLNKGIKDVAFTASEFVQLCYSNNEQFQCSQIVKPVLDYDYGLCYDITSPWQQDFTHDRHVLFFLLHLNRKNVPNSFRAYHEGIRLFLLAENTSVIIPLQHIMISPGVRASVTFSETKTEFLSVNSGMTKPACRQYERGASVNKSDEVGSFLATRDNTFWDCVYDCDQAAYYKHCGCIAIVDSKYLWQHVAENTSYCTSSFFEHCQQKHEIMVEKQSCKSQCADTCESSAFTDHTVFSRLSAEFFEANFGQKHDNVEINSTPQTKTDKENFVETNYLNVSYNEKDVNDFIVLELGYYTLGTVHMKQSPSMTFTTLTSNVGGQLGLWIGASIFTIAQLIVYCSSICISRFAEIIKLPAISHPKSEAATFKNGMKMNDFKISETSDSLVQGNISTPNVTTLSADTILSG